MALQAYRWTQGRGYKVPAQVVGEVVASIEERDGACAPSALVEVARPEQHPLHSLFTWDDDEAADRWRAHEARNVIRSLVVTVVRDDVEIEAPAYVSVGHVAANEGRGEGYRSVEIVTSDPAFADEALAEALSRLRSIRKRYAALSQLSSIWVEIDRVIEEVAS